MSATALEHDLDDIGDRRPAGSVEVRPDGYQVSIVLPTFMEAANVGAAVARLERALHGLRWQAIFVDDASPDGTAATVKQIAGDDSRVMCLHRIGRRGLAGAVMEGALASAAPVVVVMDADGQHDERLIPEMLRRLWDGEADVILASRFLNAGDADAGLSARRRLGSRLANRLARRVAGVNLSDPMSGFFAARRRVLEAVAPRIGLQGFKVLFDILACSPPGLQVMELPMRFQPRTAGASKLDRRIALDYLALLAARAGPDLVSPRALIFALVGLSGVVTHLTVLELLKVTGLSFAGANLTGALGAMASNYLLNNAITYRDRRHRGWRLLTGYLRFATLCCVGLLVNVAVASFVHEHVGPWWCGALAGAIAGASWNYPATALMLW